MSVRAAIDTPWRGTTSGSISLCAASTEGVGPRLEEESVALLAGGENGFVPALEGRDALGDERSPRRSDRPSPMKNGDSAETLTPSGRLEGMVMTRERC